MNAKKAGDGKWVQVVNDSNTSAKFSKFVALLSGFLGVTPLQTRQNRAELVVTREAGKPWFFLNSRVIKLFSALTEFSRIKPRLTMRGAS